MEEGLLQNENDLGAPDADGEENDYGASQFANTLLGNMDPGWDEVFACVTVFECVTALCSLDLVLLFILPAYNF